MAGKKKPLKQIKKVGSGKPNKRKSCLKEELEAYNKRPKEYASMSEITEKEFKDFIKNQCEIVVEDTKIPIGQSKKITRYGPDQFELECTSVWSFPKRGDWATHKGDYRGNWAPEIPRNVILRYSQEGNTVLDQMAGSGTTLVECKLLKRKSIGIDINSDAIMLARDRLDFSHPPETGNHSQDHKTYVGDARKLDKIDSNTIDLIVTHPPYANIISYSKERISDDLSKVGDITQFAQEMRKVADEAYRVLRPGKYCAILIGDTRKKKHYVPIAPRVMQSFIDAGFVLKEDIIKRQWQCKTTPFWSRKSKDFNFLLIMHEHLYIFRKPEEGEDLKKLQY